MNTTALFHLYGIVYIIYIIRSIVYLINGKLFDKDKIPNVSYDVSNTSQVLETNKKMIESVSKILVMFSIMNLIWVCRGIYNYDNTYFTILLIVGYSIPLLDFLKMMFKIFSGDLRNIKSKDIKEVMIDSNIYKILIGITYLCEIGIVFVIMNNYFQLI